MNFQNFLTMLNLVTVWGMVAFIFIYWYRILYILHAFTKEEPLKPTDKKFKYAVLIPARNESKVIANILHSLKKQDYPQDMFDVFVIVESESDPTVGIVKNFGYNYIVRPSVEGRATKGYALDDAITYIKDKGLSYDSYFIFDADNILECDFITKMNMLKAQGYQLGMGYRASKNANENLLAGCSHTLFLFLNTLTGRGRSHFIHKIVLSGTGYFLDSDLVDKAGELSYWCYENNIKCAYTSDAVFYDEQATTYKQTMKQHIRWIWGHFHADRKYRKKIRKAFFTKKGEKFAKLDFLIGLNPLIILVVFLALNIIMSLVLGVGFMFEGNLLYKLFFANALKVFLMTYSAFSLFAIITFLADHKHHSFGLIHSIRIALVFPLYLFNFILAFFKGLNKKNLTWQPIEHKGQLQVDNIETKQEQHGENNDEDEVPSNEV